VRLPAYIYLAANIIIDDNEKIGLFGYSAKHLISESGKIKAFQSGLLSDKKIDWKISDNTVRYKLITELGQGGSPIMIKKNNRYVAVAIHIGKTSTTFGEKMGRGRLITDDLI
jgi:V8-like Glu-specific endopeptidase